jgi:hypothetical protein
LSKHVCTYNFSKPPSASYTTLWVFLCKETMLQSVSKSGLQ